MSFIHLNYRQFNLYILFISESTPFRINALLTSSNYSLKRIFYQISRDQIDHDVFSNSRQVGHQQERRHLLASRRSPYLPVLTPERSDNKFFSWNDSKVGLRSTFTDEQWPRLHDTVFISYRIGFISDWPSVCTIPFSFHIGLASCLHENAPIRYASYRFRVFA